MAKGRYICTKLTAGNNRWNVSGRTSTMTRKLALTQSLDIKLATGTPTLIANNPTGIVCLKIVRPRSVSGGLSSASTAASLGPHARLASAAVHPTSRPIVAKSVSPTTTSAFFFFKAMLTEREGTVDTRKNARFDVVGNGRATTTILHFALAQPTEHYSLLVVV